MSETLEPQTARFHAVVEGRVQGVGFRYFVVEQAVRFAITGWVRNRWDGSVEVVAEGERANLERLVARLQRGPASAYVSRLQLDWESPIGEFQEFRLRSSV